MYCFLIPSIPRDACRRYQRGVTFDLAPDELVEFFRRQRHRLGAELIDRVRNCFPSISGWTPDVAARPDHIASGMNAWARRSSGLLPAAEHEALGGEMGRRADAA